MKKIEGRRSDRGRGREEVLRLGHQVYNQYRSEEDEGRRREPNGQPSFPVWLLGSGFLSSRQREKRQNPNENLCICAISTTIKKHSIYLYQEIDDNSKQHIYFKQKIVYMYIHISLLINPSFSQVQDFLEKYKL